MNGVPSSSAAPGPLSIRVRPEGVAVVTYDVAGEPVNTLKATFAADFERIFAEVERDPRMAREFDVLGVRVAIPVLDQHSLVGVAMLDERITGEPFVPNTEDPLRRIANNVLGMGSVE